jgi:hypothetical protein
VIQILSRKTKNNPVLVGDPGVGKTAIVEGLAQRIVRQDVPEGLKDKTIFNALLQIPRRRAPDRRAGRTVNFRNTVIIMTSNIGSLYLLDGIDERGEIMDDARERVFAELRGHFRRNRGSGPRRPTARARARGGWRGGVSGGARGRVTQTRRSCRKTNGTARRLQAAGYRVMRVTWRQISEQPEAVVARVAQALVRS